MLENELITGKLEKIILKFALPFMLASLLQAMYGATDLFVVGKYASAASMAAVSTGSQLMQTISGIVLGISMGGTVVIGNYVGEKNYQNVAKTIGTISVVFVLIALILTPIMLFSTNGAVAIMNTPSASIESAKQYVIICACGIPFIIGYNGVSSIFRGLGDSKTPVYFIVIATIVNIVMDFLLVGYFKMGAGGAAIATILAQAISFGASLIYLYKKGFPFEFNRHYFKIEPLLVRKIFKVGIPLALQDALVNISFLIITAIINSLGLIAAASVGVVEKLIVFAMLIPSAYASAVATICAQNMGANLPKRALTALKLGIMYSLVFMVTFCVYSQFNATTLTSIFSKDIQVIEMAATYLRSYSIDCILVCFVFCMNAYFNGCSKSLISLIHSLIATFLIRIPLSYLFSKITQDSLYFMGLAAPAASLVSIIICGFYFLYQQKKMNKQTSTKQDI